MTPRQLEAKLARDPDLPVIDVRTPAEYHAVHLTCAVNMPMDQLEACLDDIPEGTAERPLVLLCQSGTRARRCAQTLQKHGRTHVVVVEGGTRGCIPAGLPVVEGPSMVPSLERQVRIAAGSLVLLGVLLGLLVHPGLLGISAFVGAGLVFAGVTDWCGMALFLSRMPWNRGPTVASCAADAGVRKAS